ncbi:hypothetical protein [Tuwongella immobilis]|uniref:Uncharacterized protein n=1 Tax=Tuwongella immobilis TaxID=692036 RepID=A0A6C2YPH3_9BACT|nr:hypothetical protein [Tuwongella immobilis]VIP03211.1 Uncharacterized protein OS=Isosphaera pallida (strain ATCC 43644 / DSM 9630 / IS1B) GN=Isop_3659 PE=4 SV=1 [Tuwongella immobilis]VTS03721.1 Uncharacterized protein OS=Isosphaera pallida (strain ATCC 43644 / DSM 9630 / IS1B) GN=Isop_3659 PE=4 SV=1 [Tuwongella immobilis]
MVRKAGVLILLASLTGCVATNPHKSTTSQKPIQPSMTPGVPGYQGPWGQPVASNKFAPGKASLNASGIQQAGANIPAGMSGNIQQAGLFKKTEGCATCTANGTIVNPVPGDYEVGGIAPGGMMGGPGGYMGGPGMMMGGGPRPIAPPIPPMGVPGAVAAVGALPPMLPQGPLNARTSVLFSEPAGMRVSWMSGGNTEHSLDVPGRYNFLQGGVYRLKLSRINNLPNKNLYPTIEILPANQKTATFLAHSSVPVNFTEEDFEQVSAGNFLVKVIYLPDDKYQDLAVGGPGLGEIVSSRLEPNLDPIVEAQKRGTILMIIRMGNIDLQAPNTPAMDAPNPYAGGPGGPGMMMPAPSSAVPTPNAAPTPMPLPGGLAPAAPTPAPKADSKPIGMLPPAGIRPLGE